MTLKLPTPLPYDVVDQLIDEEFKFGKETFEDEIIWWCQRRNPDYTAGRPLTSNYGRSLFELLDDYDGRRTEDADGYVTVRHVSKGMRWTAQELTDEEIDEVLQLETE
jgi:hypothetical protein